MRHGAVRYGRRGKSRTDFFTQAIKFNFSILKKIIKCVKIREEKEVI